MTQARSLRNHPLENRIPPPIMVLLIGAIMWGADRFLPRLPFGLPFHVTLAVLIAACGLMIFILGVFEFRRAKTTVNPVNIQEASSVVASGIYRATRNPMYVGFTLVLLGWSIALDNALTLAGPLAFAAFSHVFQIVPEERLLKAKFGETYESYCRRVRRWL